MTDTSPVLYSDDTVRITNQEIYIFQYFFPLPMHKSIKMSDVREVNLKTDVTKNLQYLEIVVKGFTINATFAPSDPKKALQIIRARTCYNLAQGSISISKQGFRKPQTNQASEKVQQAKQNFTKGTQQLKQRASQSVQQGAQSLKQGAYNLKQGASQMAQEGKQSLMQTAQQLKEGASKKLQQGKQTTVNTAQELKQGAAQRLQQGKQTIMHTAQEISQGASKKLEQGKQTIMKGAQTVKETSKGIIGGVTGTIAAGWQQVKQVSYNIYEATTEKIHDMVSSQTQQKAHQAKQNIKQGAQNVKESAQNAKQDASKKIEKGKQQAKQKVGMEPQKTTLQNIKGMASHGFENLREGASNLLNKVADKVSEVAATNVDTQYPETKEQIAEKVPQKKETQKTQTTTFDRERPLTEQTKQKAEELVGRDAKEKARQAKQNFKQGAEDAGESVKRATGYEGSLLQEAKQNFVQGWQNTKQGAKNVYDTTTQKASEMGKNIQKKAGEKTRETGEVLIERGDKIQKNA